jgi:hypothetical protein
MEKTSLYFTFYFPLSFGKKKVGQRKPVFMQAHRLIRGRRSLSWGEASE